MQNQNKIEKIYSEDFGIFNILEDELQWPKFNLSFFELRYNLIWQHADLWYSLNV